LHAEKFICLNWHNRQGFFAGFGNSITSKEVRSAVKSVSDFPPVDTLLRLTLDKIEADILLHLSAENLRICGAIPLIHHITAHRRSYTLPCDPGGVLYVRDDIEQRAKDLALYIIENSATVRQAAKKFAISKSTVHMVVTY